MPVDLSKLSDEELPLDEEAELPEDEGADEELEGGDFTMLIEALTKFSGDMEACCDEMDSDLLKDTNKDMRTTDELILRQGFEELDDELKLAFREAGELSVEDSHEIAAQLFDEDVVEDPYQTAGWLNRISQVAQGYVSDEEAEAEEAPEEEDFEDDMDLDEDMDLDAESEA